MSTYPLRPHAVRSGVLACSLVLLLAVAIPARAATTDVQSDPTGQSNTETMGDMSRSTRQLAYDLLGDRPFQAVLMENQRVVMTASSTGTSPLSNVPLASISKVITAMTVMKLVETGKLSLGQTLGDHFSSILLPDRWRSVTIEQLLSHTSGFAADRDRWFNDTYKSCFDAFTRIVERDAPAARGYEYSNTNFCALSLIIGSVSGPSYEDAAYRLVFRPLGIGRKIMDSQYANLAGAGGWQMSAVDIARIVSALDPGAALSVLSAGSRSLMIQQTSYNYGLGVWIWDAQTFGHSGSLYRARNIAVRLPSGRVAVILTQATFPESGLDLLPIAQRLDAEFASACDPHPCNRGGLDPFSGSPSGLLGRAHV